MTVNGAVIVTSNVACTTCRSRSCLVTRLARFQDQPTTIFANFVRNMNLTMFRSASIIVISGLHCLAALLLQFLVLAMIKHLICQLELIGARLSAFNLIMCRTGHFIWPVSEKES